MRENPWFEQCADKDMKKSNFHLEIHKNSNHERWLPLHFGYSVTGAKHAEINTDRWIFVRGAAGWRWAACVTAVGSVPWQHSGAGCHDTGSSHLLAEAHLGAAPTLPLAQEFPALRTTGAAGGVASPKASPCSPQAHGAPHPFLASCQQEGAACEPSLLLVPL